MCLGAALVQRSPPGTQLLSGCEEQVNGSDLRGLQWAEGKRAEKAQPATEWAPRAYLPALDTDSVINTFSRSACFWEAFLNAGRLEHSVSLKLQGQAL